MRPVLTLLAMSRCYQAGGLPLPDRLAVRTCVSGFLIQACDCAVSRIRLKASIIAPTKRDTKAARKNDKNK